MYNPFWNREERRLRALWRFVLYLPLVGLALFAGAGLSLGVGMIILLFQPGGIPPLNDPAEFGSQVVASLSRIPFLGVLDALLGVLTLLGALWLAGRLLDRRRFADFGFHLNRAWWVDFAFGLGLGGVLMALVFLVELAAGWVQVDGFLKYGGDNFWWYLFSGFAFFIAVGVREEIIFRCYPLRVIAEGLNLRSIGPRNSLLIGYLVTSFFFGLAHLANPNATWISTVNIMLAGILLGVGLVMRGEMAIPIGLHISWNFFQGNVFGFPVSGTNAGATLIAIRQGGPELITGGEFGPEAGLVGLAAMVVGIAFSVLWIRHRTGQARLNLELSEYLPPVTRAVNAAPSVDENPPEA